MIKSELYSQEQCISDVYIYPQMSSPMLSPLSAWGLYKLASARVSLSEIGFTWHGQCNNDIRSYFYNAQQTWNMNNKKNQTVFSPLTMEVQNLLYLSWSPPLAHSGAVQELLKTKRGATCTGGGGHLVTDIYRVTTKYAHRLRVVVLRVGEEEGAAESHTGEVSLVYCFQCHQFIS